MISNRLLIFIKNPVPGRVKTRIGRVKGHEIAVKVYQKLIEHTSKVARLANDVFPKVLFNDTIEETAIWSASIFEKGLQVEGNLGQKMEYAFKDELQHSQKVVLIGSDCAAITTSHLENAFLSLDKHDVVIGPALDGGYYLIGMKEIHTPLFRDMPWSQENLLEETSKRIEKLNLKAFYLEPLSDIDYWEDWEKLGWNLNE